MVSVDSTVARAHQHAAGARRDPTGARSNHTIVRPEPDDHALGRSRGGLTTKTHLSVERRGRPLSIRLTGGQAGDNPQPLPLLDDIAVPARGRGGPTRRRPQRLIADRAYSHPSTRRALRRRRITVAIPEKTDQLTRRKAQGRAGGRPPAFDAATYRHRNVVERAVNRLKSWPGIATPTTNTPATTGPASSSPASCCSGCDEPSDTP